MLNHNYAVGETIVDEKRNLTVVEVDGDMVRVHCNECNWANNWMRKYNLTKGNGCSCCSGKIVVVGINDIPTTHPHLVKYFQGGYDEAKLYTKGSNKKINPICPDCERVSSKAKQINKIMRNGIGCSCSDKRSYPEKFIQSLLQQLHLPFEIEYVPKWSQNKRYDFYIPSLNCIIEAHGRQHYEGFGTYSTYEQEHENDLLKFDLSVINGIEHYIVLDCRKSEINYIKESIMMSKLPKILNFDEDFIDWQECERNTTTNLVKQISEYKQQNRALTTSQIGEVFGLHASRVGEILKKGNRLGWCDYDPVEEKSKVSKVNGVTMGKKNGKKLTVVNQNGEIKYYESILHLCDCSERDFRVKVNRNVVSKFVKSGELYKGLALAYQTEGVLL